MKHESLISIVNLKTKLYKAFTLAEVLIVLGIIGIVAELTIPVLVSDYKKQVYVAQLQNMTSFLTNGFKQIIVNSDCSDLACTGIMSNSANTVVDNIQAANVFKISNVCHMFGTGCHDQQTYRLDNTSSGIFNTNRHSMIKFNDGSVLSIYNTSSDCTRNVGNNQYSATCNMDGYMDVNGEKPPNTLGRDIFQYYLSKYGNILPAGVSDDTYMKYWNDTVGNPTYNCVIGSGRGSTCFGRVFEEGWRMTY